MKIIKRKDLVDWTLQQKGKPFEPQARGPHAYDCVGLIVGCANEFEIQINDLKGYANIPSEGLFLKAIDDNLEKVNKNDVKIGDLVIFAWSGEYHHIAMITQTNPISIVHALNRNRCVTTHDFTGTSWERLRHKFYRFKDVILEEEQGE